MNNEKWLEHYRTNKNAIWIKCKLTNGEDLFFDNFNGWKLIKEKCDSQSLFIDKLFLQFRSHEIDIDINNCDGIYLVQSIIGQFGADTKKYYTTGKIIGNKVYKKMWMIPELICNEEFEDDITDCFAEAIIYDKTKKVQQK
jgi:hypothetical protein